MRNEQKLYFVDVNKCQIINIQEKSQRIIVNSVFVENMASNLEENLDFCYICQESSDIVGHTILNCPKSKCKKCGMSGHIIKSCPTVLSEFLQSRHVPRLPRPVPSGDSDYTMPSTRCLETVRKKMTLL